MFIHGPRLWLLAPTALFGTIAYYERDAGMASLFIFFLVVTAAMWRYDNRYEIQEVQKAKSKTEKLKKIQETPVRTTLPTEDETKMAQAQLQVAWSIIERAQLDKRTDGALSTLEKAPLPLSKVRQLDPHATIDVKLNEKKDDTTTLTHDRMTAYMLYLESQWLDEQVEGSHDQGMNIAQYGSRSDLRKHQREVNAWSARSRAAIDRAVQYEPEHVPYLLHLAQHASSPVEQKQIIQRVLQLEPYNVEALEIANRLG